MKNTSRPAPAVAGLALALYAVGSSAAAPDLAVQSCNARSTEVRTPVIELYTSEGCSSCPPADQWLSTLKGRAVVAQAFHVSYWDYIGWVDRFASAANNARQRELAGANRLGGVYTPQLVRNGQDWREYSTATQATGPAGASIELRRVAGADHFEARVEPRAGVQQWAAYWSATEDAHQSRVKAGENAGSTLTHDFVVRQYVPVGQYTGAQTLTFFALPASAGHPRRVNLVVFDPRTLEPLQALSLQCS